MSRYSKEKESLSYADVIIKKQIRQVILFVFFLIIIPVLYGVYHLYSTSTNGATSLVQKEVGYNKSLHFWDYTKVSESDSDYVCGDYSIYPPDFTVQDAAFFHNRPRYAFIVNTSTDKVYLQDRDNDFYMIFTEKCDEN
ncbi:hypothetical protein [Xenorhabdus bovienii]|uniref:hypothetical protein n=1 Tax=Xenorhabdus bovienii TaxID=40576 RepID=UPI0023B3198D|nr:hypothetical protein [Xenorhabdus bovienii]MDE9463387.1 hypothetical protein [Xenorhabdus bovienii]MDE9471052.1 hypothetical protein [Xenorhabdus bovienii]